MSYFNIALTIMHHLPNVTAAWVTVSAVNKQEHCL